MSSYTKKYTSIKNENNHLFLTWETGYRNLKIYHEGNLIHTVENPWQLTNGVSFEHSELGTIELYLTTTSPMTIDLKVGDEKYFAENMKESFKKEAFSGLVAVFWTMSALAFIGALFVQINFDFRIEVPLVLIELVFDIIVIGLYVVSAIFLSRRKVWAYYLGGITFLAVTLLYIYVGYLQSLNFISIIVIVVRIAILIYIIRCYKDVTLAKAESDNTSTEILDTSESTELEF